MPIEQPAIQFDKALAEAIGSFRAERRKILAAAESRLLADPALTQCLKEPASRRIALESAKIFIENFGISVRFGLPNAILDYLEWLRRFLLNRGIPQAFTPRMVYAVQIAARAFMPDSDGDLVCGLLRDLRKIQRTAIEST